VLLLRPTFFFIWRAVRLDRALHVFCNPKRSSKDKGQGFLLGEELLPKAFPLSLSKMLLDLL
jgi:hypothetical protein